MEQCSRYSLGTLSTMALVNPQSAKDEYPQYQQELGEAMHFPFHVQACLLCSMGKRAQPLFVHTTSPFVFFHSLNIKTAIVPDPCRGVAWVKRVSLCHLLPLHASARTKVQSSSQSPNELIFVTRHFFPFLPQGYSEENDLNRPLFVLHHRKLQKRICLFCVRQWPTQS